jgi:hypothetical protein
MGISGIESFLYEVIGSGSETGYDRLLMRYWLTVLRAMVGGIVRRSVGKKDR